MRILYAGSVQVELLIPAPARVWHDRLRQRLLAQGHVVVAQIVEHGPGRPAGFEALRLLEATLYRAVEGGGGSDVCQELRPEAFVSDIDLCIDLTGRHERFDTPAPCLVPLADGAVGELAVLAALAGDRSPELSILCCRSIGNAVLARGMAGLEEPHQLIRSFERVCGRWADLILMAVGRFMSGATGEVATAASGATLMGPLSLPKAALSRIAARIAGRLLALSRGQEHWRIAWRQTAPGTSLHERLAWPQQPYEILSDDAARYYADPFLFSHEGRTWLFCEEFPFATARGLISVVEMGPDGVMGVPQPVLEEDCHLSYPQVFAHEGEVFMIPETSGRATIELWRAEQLPGGWVKVATLVSGVRAADVTLIRHGDLWWLFAALSQPGEASWDTLGLFHATRLEGPWTSHVANPVVIDARAARPAGRSFFRDGALWRPVQDCSAGYGSRLAFARIEQLDPDSFVQTLVASLATPARWQARGAHTVDALPGLEAIDVLCPPKMRLAGEQD